MVNPLKNTIRTNVQRAADKNSPKRSAKQATEITREFARHDNENKDNVVNEGHVQKSKTKYSSGDKTQLRNAIVAEHKMISGDKLFSEASSNFSELKEAGLLRETSEPGKFETTSLQDLTPEQLIKAYQNTSSSLKSITSSSNAEDVNPADPKLSEQTINGVSLLKNKEVAYKVLESIVCGRVTPLGNNNLNKGNVEGVERNIAAQKYLLDQFSGDFRNKIDGASFHRHEKMDSRGFMNWGSVKLTDTAREFIKTYILPLHPDIATEFAAYLNERNYGENSTKYTQALTNIKNNTPAVSTDHSTNLHNIATLAELQDKIELALGKAALIQKARELKDTHTRLNSSLETSKIQLEACKDKQVKINEALKSLESESLLTGTVLNDNIVRDIFQHVGYADLTTELGKMWSDNSEISKDQAVTSLQQLQAKITGDVNQLQSNIRGIEKDLQKLFQAVTELDKEFSEIIDQQQEINNNRSVWDKVIDFFSTNSSVDQQINELEDTPAKNICNNIDDIERGVGNQAVHVARQARTMLMTAGGIAIGAILGGSGAKNRIVGAATGGVIGYIGERVIRKGAYQNISIKLPESAQQQDRIHENARDAGNFVTKFSRRVADFKTKADEQHELTEQYIGKLAEHEKSFLNVMEGQEKFVRNFQDFVKNYTNNPKCLNKNNHYLVHDIRVTNLLGNKQPAVELLVTTLLEKKSKLDVNNYSELKMKIVDRLSLPEDKNLFNALVNYVDTHYTDICVDSDINAQKLHMIINDLVIRGARFNDANHSRSIANRMNLFNEVANRVDSAELNFDESQKVELPDVATHGTLSAMHQAIESRSEKLNSDAESLKQQTLRCEKNNSARILNAINNEIKQEDISVEALSTNITAHNETVTKQSKIVTTFNQLNKQVQENEQLLANIKTTSEDIKLWHTGCEQILQSLEKFKDTNLDFYKNYKNRIAALVEQPVVEIDHNGYSLENLDDANNREVAYETELNIASGSVNEMQMTAARLHATLKQELYDKINKLYDEAKAISEKIDDENIKDKTTKLHEFNSEMDTILDKETSVLITDNYLKFKDKLQNNPSLVPFNIDHEKAKLGKITNISEDTRKNIITNMETFNEYHNSRKEYDTTYKALQDGLTTKLEQLNDIMGSIENSEIRAELQRDNDVSNMEEKKLACSDLGEMLTQCQKSLDEKININAIRSKQKEIKNKFDKYLNKPDYLYIDPNVMNESGNNQPQVPNPRTELTHALSLQIQSPVNNHAYQAAIEMAHEQIVREANDDNSDDFRRSYIDAPGSSSRNTFSVIASPENNIELNSEQIDIYIKNPENRENILTRLLANIKNEYKISLGGTNGDGNPPIGTFLNFANVLKRMCKNYSIPLDVKQLSTTYRDNYIRAYMLNSSEADQNQALKSMVEIKNYCSSIINTLEGKMSKAPQLHSELEGTAEYLFSKPVELSVCKSDDVKNKRIVRIPSLKELKVLSKEAATPDSMFMERILADNYHFAIKKASDNYSSKIDSFRLLNSMNRLTNLMVADGVKLKEVVKKGTTLLSSDSENNNLQRTFKIFLETSKQWQEQLEEPLSRCEQLLLLNLQVLTKELEGRSQLSSGTATKIMGKVGINNAVHIADKDKSKLSVSEKILRSINQVHASLSSRLDCDFKVDYSDKKLQKLDKNDFANKQFIISKDKELCYLDRNKEVRPLKLKGIDSLLRSNKTIVTEIKKQLNTISDEVTEITGLTRPAEVTLVEEITKEQADNKINKINEQLSSQGSLDKLIKSLHEPVAFDILNDTGKLERITSVHDLNKIGILLAAIAKKYGAGTLEQREILKQFIYSMLDNPYLNRWISDNMIPGIEKPYALQIYRVANTLITHNELGIEDNDCGLKVLEFNADDTTPQLSKHLLGNIDQRFLSTMARDVYQNILLRDKSYGGKSVIWNKGSDPFWDARCKFYGVEPKPLQSEPEQDGMGSDEYENVLVGTQSKRSSFIMVDDSIAGSSDAKVNRERLLLMAYPKLVEESQQARSLPEQGRLDAILDPDNQPRNRRSSVRYA